MLPNLNPSSTLTRYVAKQDMESNSKWIIKQYNYIIHGTIRSTIKQLVCMYVVIIQTLHTTKSLLLLNREACVGIHALVITHKFFGKQFEVASAMRVPLVFVAH